MDGQTDMVSSLKSCIKGLMFETNQSQFESLCVLFSYLTSHKVESLWLYGIPGLNPGSESMLSCRSPLFTISHQQPVK
jgi:hypothetical protein